MKAKKISNDFVPITIQITLESEEDARAMFALFNRTTNANLIGYRTASDIREIVGQKYWVQDGVIAHGITSRDFYRMEK